MATMTTEVIVTACTQENMREILYLLDDGMPIKLIAQKVGYAYSTTQRYIRLYEKFGIDVFIKEKYVA